MCYVNHYVTTYVLVTQLIIEKSFLDQLVKLTIMPKSKEGVLLCQNLCNLPETKNKMCLWNTNMSPGYGHFFFKVDHESRSRSQVKIVYMSGKSLSQGTYMPNLKALSETVQKLWPMLELSNQQTNNKPTDRAKTICPRYRNRGHKIASAINNMSNIKNLPEVLFMKQS